MIPFETCIGQNALFLWHCKSQPVPLKAQRCRKVFGSHMKMWVSEKGKEFCELQVWLRARPLIVSATYATEFPFINISVIFYS